MGCISNHKEIICRIRLIVRRKSVFKNYKYSREDLANELGIGITLLSTILSKEMHTSFQNLLNKQRITYAKSLLGNPEAKGMTIDEVAVLSGFSCRQSLYRAINKYKTI